MNSSRKLTFLFHIFGWLLFVSLPLLFLNRGEGSQLLNQFLLSYQVWLFLGVFMLLYYINYSFLIPRLFFQKKYVLYGIFTAVGFTLITLVQPFDRLVMQYSGGRIEQRGPGRPPNVPDSPPMPPPGSPGVQPPAPSRQRPVMDIVSVMLFVMLWALGLAIRISQNWYQIERRAIRAEADKAQAELMSLKAQINPHFLFNTLNTIYTMVKLNHPSGAESIMKLSNIMRYVSDEVMDDFVPLEDEIECIRQYIELQRLRLNKKTTVQFTVEGELALSRIPPLIMMTFVENIFKHGLSNHETSLIEIQVVTNSDGISFFSRNKKFNNASLTTRTGIGLENIRKRLNYLYPGRHQLDIQSIDGYFTVNLKIEA